MITVVGAGAVGVLTAHFLARDGHDVTLVEREAMAAERCSFGNAGLIAVGHAEAWAGPDAPMAIVKAALGRDPAVKLSRPFDPALFRWGLSFLKHCTSSAHHRNSDALMRLSAYSRILIEEIEGDLGTGSAAESVGGLYVFRNEEQFRKRADDLTKANDANPKFQVLEKKALFASEPAFAANGDDIAGAILSTRDYYRDCPSSVREITAALQDMPNVNLRFNTAVQGFSEAPGGSWCLHTDYGDIQSDHIVFATGSSVPHPLAQLGIRPNIYPVKGYSITYPVLDAAGVPTLPVVDETKLCAITTQPGSLRITAIAEFAGHDTTLTARHLDQINAVAQSMFGDALDYENSKRWTGLRPTTPSSRPYLGRIKNHRNLWINAGHGQLGWTMAAGSGRILADLLVNKTPALSDVSEQARWLEPF